MYAVVMRIKVPTLLGLVHRSFSCINSSLHMRIAFTHNVKISDAEAEAEFDTVETVERITGLLQSLGHDVFEVEVSGPPARVLARIESSEPDLIFNTAEGSF